MILPFCSPLSCFSGIAGPEEAKNLAGKSPPPDSDPCSDSEFELISPAVQAQLRRQHEPIRAHASGSGHGAPRQLEGQKEKGQSLLLTLRRALVAITIRPRPLRIQYAGVRYHVLSRRDRHERRSVSKMDRRLNLLLWRIHCDFRHA